MTHCSKRYSHTECYCVYAGKLLSSFGLGWSIAIDRVSPSPDMAKSPLQPLLVTVTRIPQPTSRKETQEWQQEQQQDKVDGQIDDVHSEDGHSSDVVEDKQACTAVPLVHLSFGAEAGVVNSEQLADVIKVHPWCLLHLITQLSAKMPCFRQHLHEHIYSSRPLHAIGFWSLCVSSGPTFCSCLAFAPDLCSCAFRSSVRRLQSVTKKRVYADCGAGKQAESIRPQNTA